MSTKGVPGIPVAVIAAGGILLWSGIFNQSLTSALGSLLTGQAPTKGAQNTISVSNSGDVPGGTGTNTSASVAANASETQWVDSLLAAVGASNTSANVSSVTNWIAHEKPDWSQWNNPLNTTESGYGGTSVTGIGVKQYPTLQDGLNATVACLNNGYYGDILSNLHAGIGLKSGASQGLSTWSGGGYTSV